jgi:pimeloyl-ACP methyl ester carboxylesterase
MRASTQADLPRRRHQLELFPLESDFDLVPSIQIQGGAQILGYDNSSGIINGSFHAINRTEAIESGGRRIAWRSLGEGPSLLLLNGYAATAVDWDPGFLAALARSFELICPDNRGMGESELGDPTEPLSVDSMAADAEAVLDALDVERLPVAGWSMGGFVAQALALRAPARVEALVLLATDPGGDAAVPGDAATWARLTDRSGTPREQASRLISVLFPADLAPGIDREFGDLVAEARAALDPATLDAQERAIDAWHAEKQPAPGPGAPPVLAACGEEDAVIPPANAEALATRWPGCRAERFAGCGHALMAQEPDRLADLIRSFVPAPGR